MIEKMLITLHKISSSTGIATLQFQDINEESLFIINQIHIDLNNGASPISIPKMSSVPVVQGLLIEEGKAAILGMFQEYNNLKPGIYALTI